LPLVRTLSFCFALLPPAMGALGLEALAQVPVRLLSSGQLKRATLARVAASAAPLWLLDEPLNALDIDGAERLSQTIDRHLAGGGAVLAASHQPLPGEWRTLELAA
jgi:heme exporter protein A